MRISKKLIRTAHHEAGHAVAAFQLSLPLRKVTIVPDALTNGHTVWLGVNLEDLSLGGLRRRDKIERVAMAYLAGAMVEKLLLDGFDCSGASGDFVAFDKLVCHLVTCDQERKPYGDLLLARTAQIFRDEANAHAVRHLATVLLERRTLTGRQAIRVIMQAKAAKFKELGLQP